MSGTASNGQTSYAYDAQGNLTSVTDPNGNITSYSYDSFDNLIQQNSPDTGITSYTYDDAGNRISQTDANGVTTRYSYDALNRLIEIDYPNAKLNVNFTYDENGGGQNGVGRLTSQEDASGTTKYTYDLRGNVLTQTSIRGSITLTMGYAYNSADQLVQATYPDGRRFDYQYDASGNISDITTDYQGTVQSVISNIQHQPFGPVMGMTYGNGLTLGQIYDLDTRLTQSTTPSILERGYGFDDGSNITSITNDLDPSATESFGYDNLNRLETAGGSYGSLGYSYDPTHNRTQKTDSIEGDTYYDYDLNNNHLTAVTAGDTKNYQYDAVGNIVDNNSYRFDYADNNRLAAVKVGNKKIATYKYNGQGQRTEKIIGKITTHYLYGLQGELLAEIETTRKSQGVLRNYLYLNGRPVAITEASSLYYIHSDHLGTPQVITDQNQANVWRASYSPFGQALITTEVIVNNIRFPGQYYDQESNLHYNYFRYYDPSIGRYITSDPIGLDGGINTYSYVYNNSLSLIDPYGLLGFTWHGNWGGPGRVNGQNYRNPTHPNRPSTGWREGDNFPRQGDEGFVPPVDPRDQAYYGHDICISDCEKKNDSCSDNSSTSECIARCDIDLSNTPTVPWYERNFFRWYSRQR
jgi:RHS repeat-associated protein